MSTDVEALRIKLTTYNQHHLLHFWDELTEDQKQSLKNDIKTIHLSEVNSFFKRAMESLEDCEKLDDRLKPIPSVQFGSALSTSPKVLDDYEGKGLEAISKGQVGVIVMAGGQGTRLGSTAPKGMYDVGLPSKKSLFQIQAERILKLESLAEKKTGTKGNITWYVLVSEPTAQPTLDYFIENNYFGLSRDNIKMFNQGSLPCFDFDGKIILDQKYRVAMAPDGNGGIYRALYERGILDDIEKRGIKHLHAHAIDNILIKVADPVFIGYCIAKNADCAAKVVEKAYPTEAVGVVCLVDGQYQVVEYSEITQKTAELRNPDGKLTFNAGNICNHYFSAQFLRKVADCHESELKLHVAKKKIACVDTRGVRTMPDQPNGIKIEKFVFDVFQFAKSFAIFEVPRNVEFSALKNADSAGKDCPKTSRNDVFSLHRGYIKSAGGVIGDAVDVEISPLLTYAGEGLRDIVKGKDFKSSPFLLKDKSEMSKL